MSAVGWVDGSRRLPPTWKTTPDPILPVVFRRLAGTPLPLLKLFKEESVVEAFHQAWQSGQVEPFGEKARWAVEVFREGDEVRGLVHALHVPQGVPPAG